MRVAGYSIAGVASERRTASDRSGRPPVASTTAGHRAARARDCDRGRDRASRALPGDEKPSGVGAKLGGVLGGPLQHGRSVVRAGYAAHGQHQQTVVLAEAPAVVSASAPAPAPTMQNTSSGTGCDATWPGQ